MSDFQVFGKCFFCKKRRLLIRKRNIAIPAGITVLSHKLFCNKCAIKLQATLTSKP